MFEIFSVGVPGGDAFLLITREKTALIDAGYAFYAEKMIGNIKEKLGERPLDYVLLTHTHYDHASGSAYCRCVWNDVKVVAGEYAGKVFSRPSAITVIREMNDNAAKLWGAEGYADKLDDLSIDIIVKDGDIIDLGSVKLRAIEAPGHTKCSIAFYSEEEKLLISCETLGTKLGEASVVPCYLVGYDMAISSIEKVMRYAPEHILLPHRGIISGEKCAQFLEESLSAARETKERIIQGYTDGKTVDELIADMKEWFYTAEYRVYQPEEAFLLNASYMVPMLIRECLGKQL